MTRTISDRIRDAIQALFAQPAAAANKTGVSPDIIHQDEAEDDRRRAYERDDEFHRLWAMHGHW